MTSMNTYDSDGLTVRFRRPSMAIRVPGGLEVRVGELSRSLRCQGIGGETRRCLATRHRFRQQAPIEVLDQLPVEASAAEDSASANRTQPPNAALSLAATKVPGDW